MDFEYSKRTREYLDQLADFMARHVYPSEQTFLDQLDAARRAGRCRRSWKS